MISLKVKLFFSLIVLTLCWMITFRNFTAKKSHKTQQTVQIKRNNTLNPELNSYLNIILEPFELCKENLKEKFIFIYVFVAIGSFDKRDAIRRTWANKSVRCIQVAFIIGKSFNSDINLSAKEEHQKNNDLIQG